MKKKSKIKEQISIEEKRLYYSYDFAHQIKKLGFSRSLRKALVDLPSYKDAILRTHSSHLQSNQEWAEFLEFNIEHEIPCDMELFLYLKKEHRELTRDWRNLYLIYPKKILSRTYRDHHREIERLIPKLHLSFAGTGIFDLISQIESEFQAYSKWLKEEKLYELRKYFLSQRAFDNCAFLDWERSLKFFKTHSNVGAGMLVPRVRPMVKHALNQVVYGFFVEAEKAWRIKNGLPEFDYKWKSEADLYIYLKKNLHPIAVEIHASPHWLGRQHFDIYLPIQNIAIEYQGDQHSRPVEFFGGTEAFKETKRRDALKRRLAKENGCSLIFAYPGTDFEIVLKKLRNLVK